MTTEFKQKLNENAKDICSYISAIKCNNNYSSLLTTLKDIEPVIFSYDSSDTFSFSYQKRNIMFGLNGGKFYNEYAEDLIIDVCKNWASIKTYIEYRINNLNKTEKLIMDFKV